MAGHPQDHGWRELYRLFSYGLQEGAPELTNTVRTFRKSRSDCSHAHLITLIGIAVKEVDPISFGVTVDTGRARSARLETLESTLREHGEEIAGILALRQNSFTAARRFLVPQIVLGAYFARSGGAVNFADLGTGLGALPRQLNSRRLFDEFSRDLSWPGAAPVYQPIPLAARFGVERGPMPDVRWVHACYGAGPYYAALYQELMLALATPEVAAADVSYAELNLLAEDALRAFLIGNRINAVNLSYVLYEIDPDSRNRIIDVLTEVLRPPKLILITEPVADLAEPGCTVTLHDDSRQSPRLLFTVSDGHLRGTVSPTASSAGDCATWRPSGNRRNSSSSCPGSVSTPSTSGLT
jgi:hypothetical protein